MWVFQLCDSLSLLEKRRAKSCCLCALHILQHELDGGVRFEVDLFTQVDLPEAALSNLANQAIISQLLPHPVRHACNPFHFLLSLQAFLMCVMELGNGGVVSYGKVMPNLWMNLSYPNAQVIDFNYSVCTSHTLYFSSAL